MLLQLYSALGISNQHNPPHHETQIHVRSWLVTEGKAYKPHNGRKQHHRRQGCRISPSQHLLKLLQIQTVLHRHEFETQIKFKKKITTNKLKKNKKPPQTMESLLIPFPVIYLASLSNFLLLLQEQFSCP